MDNEKIVTEIQKGNKELVNTLFMQNIRLTKHFAYKYYRVYNSLCKRLGLEIDDFINASYIRLTEVVNGYKIGSNFNFATYYIRHMKNCFNELLQFRTKKAKYEPLNSCYMGFDTPYSEDNDTALCELIPDIAATAKYNDIEHKLYISALRTDLLRAMEFLTELQRAVIKVRYMDNKTQKETAEQLNITLSAVIRLEGSAISKIRKSIYFKKLQEYL